jgi:hypothetical protein
MQRKTKIVMGIILILGLITLANITKQIDADDGKKEKYITQDFDPGNGGTPGGSETPPEDIPSYETDFHDQPIIPIMIGNIPFVPK